MSMCKSALLGLAVAGVAAAGAQGQLEATRRGMVLENLGSCSPPWDGERMVRYRPECDDFLCGSNSPVVDGVAIAPARRLGFRAPLPDSGQRVFHRRTCDEFLCTGNSPVVGGAAIAAERVLKAPSLRAALSDGERMVPYRPECDDFLCTSNSPIMDGAAVARPGPATPAPQ